MKYWLDLFTGTTWQEFLADGAHTTGFRETMRQRIARVALGDILICYLTGVKVWVGALEVKGTTRDETRRIWHEDLFPVRLDVAPIITVEPEYGVPLSDLEGRAVFYESAADRGGYKGFFRASLQMFQRDSDAKLILELLQQAKTSPVKRKVDARDLARRPTYLLKRKIGRQNVEVPVTIPEKESPVTPPVTAPTKVVEFTQAETRHTEIQAELLRLGADMGFDVWVARNDRTRLWRDTPLGQMDRMLTSLPTQFNDITTRTIELIDVLWLKGNSIQAAFEVEATTAVYSGLLRLSDLLALQPNIEIDLYIVAPDDRRTKVRQEILRPTFQLRDKPLSTVCGFLAFSTVTDKLAAIRQLGIERSLKADFLKTTAEFFGGEPVADFEAG
jgi:hypothetical protein